MDGKNSKHLKAQKKTQRPSLWTTLCWTLQRKASVSRTRSGRWDGELVWNFRAKAHWAGQVLATAQMQYSHFTKKAVSWITQRSAFLEFYSHEGNNHFSWNPRASSSSLSLRKWLRIQNPGAKIFWRETLYVSVETGSLLPYLDLTSENKMVFSINLRENQSGF